MSRDGDRAALLLYNSIYGGKKPVIAAALHGLSTSMDLVDVEPTGIDWADRISIREFGQGGRCTDLSSGPESWLSFPAWSPNGSWLAFVVKTPAEHQLWVSSYDGELVRRIGQVPINTFVSGGTVASSATIVHQHVPYEWSDDSKRIVFSAPLRPEMAMSERVDRFQSPIVLDTRAPAVSRDLYQPMKREATSYALRSKLVEASIGGDWSIREVTSLEGLHHLEYWDSHRFLIGELELESEWPKSEFRIVDAAELGSDNWRSSVSPLPTNNRRNIFAGADPSDAPVIVTSEIGDCPKKSAVARSVVLICLTQPSSGVAHRDQLLIVTTLGGLVQTFDKGSGALLYEVRVLHESDTEFANRNWPLVDSNGEAAVDSQGRMLVFDSSFDNGGLRSIRISAVDLLTGESQLLFDDPDNELKIIHVGHLLDSGKLFIQIAEDSGQFSFGSLDLTSLTVELLGPSQISQYSYSDFEYQDVSYFREDSVSLRGRIFWPRTDELETGKKLPMVIWQYPVQFESSSEVEVRYRERAADRYATTSRLDYVGETLPFALIERGFAVFHYPSFPVIGDDDDQSPGSFKVQMLMNAEAAVKAAAATGRVDANRIAIAGHSRGGGDAALLLAYSDLFATAVSVSGQMNPLLMTYIKQYDDRPFWEAPEVYVRNSASAQANLINEPILMIHGIDDRSNARSDVSESLFRAIKSVSGDARLVLVPFMEHQLRSQKEKNIVVEESVEWLLYYLYPDLPTPERSSAMAEGVKLEQPTIH